MLNSLLKLKNKSLIVFIIFSIQLRGQDTLKTRYLINFPPLKSFTENPINKTHGLSLGLWNSPFSKQTVNGINIEIIGYGWVTPFLAMDNSNYVREINQKINGLSIGGTIMNQLVNGIVISPTISTINKVNGIQISLFNFSLIKTNGAQIALTNYGNQNNGITIGGFNWSHKSNGVQIGIINKSKSLKGFQFGLININQQRTLPLINWVFKN